MTTSNKSALEKQKRVRAELKAVREFALKNGLNEAAEILKRHLNNKYRLAKTAELPRKFGGPAVTPNRNNSSGIPGIRAFYSVRDGRATLQFVATWMAVDDDNRKTGRMAQFSTSRYGLKEALGMALKARGEGAKVRVPSVENAWKIISARLKEPEGELVSISTDKRPLRRRRIPPSQSGT